MSELKGVKYGKLFDRGDAEEFLNSKDIWNHPIITDRNNKESYEVADLMAEFANTRQGWISVGDRLPEKATWSGDLVIVHTEEGYTYMGLYEGEDAEDWLDKFYDSGHITHWMPLPDSPKDN